MLMDLVTFGRYERFGTSLDSHGTPLGPGTRRDLPYLDAAERAMYYALTDPAWKRYRRIEQERVPLKDALAALRLLQLTLSPRVVATLADSERKHGVNDFSSASIAIGRCCADQRGGDMRSVRASIPRSAFEPCRPADRNDRREIR